VNQSAINKEISICSSIIDTTNNVLEGLRHLSKCTGVNFKVKILYFTDLITTNRTRIKQLRAALAAVPPA
jgi:hypothetical protein